MIEFGWKQYFVIINKSEGSYNNRYFKAICNGQDGFDVKYENDIDNAFKFKTFREAEIIKSIFLDSLYFTGWLILPVDSFGVLDEEE